MGVGDTSGRGDMGEEQWGEEENTPIHIKRG